MDLREKLKKLMAFVDQDCTHKRVVLEDSHFRKYENTALSEVKGKITHVEIMKNKTKLSK
jgi:hypothetical protein